MVLFGGAVAIPGGLSHRGSLSNAPVPSPSMSRPHPAMLFAENLTGAVQHHIT